MIISPPFAWFLVGVVFFAAELALPGFIIFFFGIGAWITALAVYFLTVSLTGQLIVFLVASLLSLLLLRKYLNAVFSGSREQEADSSGPAASGSSGVVTETIDPPAEGRIKYGGSFWRASSDEKITTGCVVEIVEQDGLVLRVKPKKS